MDLIPGPAFLRRPGPKEPVVGYEVPGRPRRSPGSSGGPEQGLVDTAGTEKASADFNSFNGGWIKASLGPGRHRCCSAETTLPANCCLPKAAPPSPNDFPMLTITLALIVGAHVAEASSSASLGVLQRLRRSVLDGRWSAARSAHGLGHYDGMIGTERGLAGTVVTRCGGPPCRVLRQAPGYQPADARRLSYPGQGSRHCGSAGSVSRLVPPPPAAREISPDLVADPLPPPQPWPDLSADFDHPPVVCQGEHSSQRSRPDVDGESTSLLLPGRWAKLSLGWVEACRYRRRDMVAGSGAGGCSTPRRRIRLPAAGWLPARDLRGAVRCLLLQTPWDVGRHGWRIFLWRPFHLLVPAMRDRDRAAGSSRPDGPPRAKRSVGRLRGAFAYACWRPAP